MIYVITTVHSSFDNYHERVLFATKREDLAKEYVNGLNDIKKLYDEVVSLVRNDYLPEWEAKNPRPSTKYIKDINNLILEHSRKKEQYRSSKIEELFLQLVNKKFLTFCEKFDLDYKYNMGHIEYEAVELIEFMKF